MELIDAKSIIIRAKPNCNYLSFDYVMNIYWGCNHGCIYCYARSDYYDKIGKLNGNFDCIKAKKDALKIIRNDLSKKIKTGVILTGGISDPYNYEEKEHKLTRNALELINAYEYGICIITKSDLVKRDTDVLLDIKEHSPTSVNFSITCSDDDMCKKIEPHVSSTTERLKAIESLSKKGIITGVLMDPVIPYITDYVDNIRMMVKKAKYYGANYIYFSPQVTMSDGQREYFYNNAEKYYPGITDKYKKKYKKYYYCRSSNSKRLWNAFVEECEKKGIQYDMNTVNKSIRMNYENIQLKFNL